MFHEKLAKTSTMARRLGIALCGLAMACGVQQAGAAIPETERVALINLYNSTDGANWTNSQNWLGPAGTECNWYGVVCDDTQSYVVEIKLSQNQLGGTLSDISAFTHIQHFSVYDNHLSGHLPDIKGLTELQTFSIAKNQLTGSLPELSRFPNISQFDAGGNQLTGSIPDLSQSTQLWFFIVSDNNLTGEIPSLEGLTILRGFYAYNNHLTGRIPSLSGLQGLSFFYVNDNLLSGPLPDLDGLPLRWLHADNNELSGPIPSLSGLSQLQEVYLGHNRLSGEIPSLSGLQQLERVELQYNYLSGELPDLAGLSNLRLFEAEHNRLRGAIPPFAGRGLDKLAVLILGDNLLDGEIPPFIDVPHFYSIDVRNNHLTGNIPDLPSPISWVNISGNQISGTLDSLQIGSNTFVHVFDARDNQLSGSIQNLDFLYDLRIVFDVSHNFFVGGIPSLESFDDFAEFDVSDNAFSGPPPTPPSGSAGLVGALCPNYLDPVPASEWDSITGQSPWYQSCSPPPAGIDVLPVSIGSELVVGDIAQKTMIVTNNGDLDLTWSVEATMSDCASPAAVGWLSLNAVGGVNQPGTTTALLATLDASGLAAGSYSAKLCVASDDATNPLVEVPVALVVKAEAPFIVVSPTSIEATAASGGNVPVTMTIANAGRSDLHWNSDAADSDCSLAGGVAWIDGVPTGASANIDAYMDIEVVLDAAALTPGIYSATLCFLSDDPEQPRVEVPVTFEVNGSPALAASPTSFSVEALQGASVPSTLTIANAGNADLNWMLSTAQNSCGAAGMVVPWIEIHPSSGTTAANASNDAAIVFDATSLSAGTHSAMICVDSNDPDHPHVELPVTFTVAPAMPIARVDPTSFDVTTTTGSLIEASLSIENTGTADLHWNLGTAKEDCAAPGPVSWIVNAQEIGTVLPGDSRSVVIGFDATNVPPGSFSAELCLSSDDPDHPMITMPVGFTVNPEPLGDAIYVNGFDGPGFTPIGHH